MCVSSTKNYLHLNPVQPIVEHMLLAEGSFRLTSNKPGPTQSTILDTCFRKFIGRVWQTKLKTKRT